MSDSVSQLPRTAAEAKKVGSTRYDDGTTCKNGHPGPRYTSNHGCVACDRATGAARSQKYRDKDPFNRRMLNTRSRCLRMGIPFETEAYEEAWAGRGTHCPCLGMEFSDLGAGVSPNSPEMDRIVPGLGYVRGNIWVISRQANKMKNDGTAAMLRQIADAVDLRIAEGENHAKSSR